ncbi:MAG TPA: glycosyltransferase family 9 protein [Bacteroidia bacterium]|nr:glycosyltransferase family 9 protein [Bacteroidia bacterium]
MSKHIKYKLPAKGQPIKKILVIRLQASGDVMIAMPYLYDLRKKLPAGTLIDLLVREEAEKIPECFTIFDKIYSLKGKRNTKLQLLHFFSLWPFLFFKKYDVLIDLQNHRLSKVIRLLLPAKAWTIFDRTSANYAGTRYRNTINSLQIVPVQFKTLDCFKSIDENAMLTKFGLEKGGQYIVINPAGAFENRNWSLDNYIEFCRLWLQKVNDKTKFLILGIDKIKHKATYIKEKLGTNVIDLTSKTTTDEALHILRHVKLIVSDDSGLLHMAYCIGKPTIGILGSTRNDWTNPSLPHTYFFNSSDLPCGNCMLEKCLFNEVNCLVRVKPEQVLEAALNLISEK